MGGNKSKPLAAPGTFDSPMEACLAYYEAKVLPAEKRHLFADFYSPPLDKAELEGIPSVLICGQYSVGKTSLISYLLDTPYPGARVGPEPTTDVFVFVKHAEGPPRPIPGPALLAQADFPFKSLGKFGHEFTNRVNGATLPCTLLKDVMLIDTPGILSGEKQRVSRGYEFHEVIRFLADKVDRIWILFDVAKMDISDEFKLVIQRLEDNVDKVRIILNKADAVPADELVRVRGALMWNLGKILTAPEIPQVYLGSFWSQKLKRTDLRDAFRRDYLALIADLRGLKRHSGTRKINDVVKRAKKVQVHVHLMNRMLLERGCTGCRSKQATIDYWTSETYRMRKLFHLVEVRDRVPKADFPDPDEFILASKNSDQPKWLKARPLHLEDLAEFLNSDVGQILNLVKHQEPPEPAKLTPPTDGVVAVANLKNEADAEGGIVEEGNGEKGKGEEGKEEEGQVEEEKKEEGRVEESGESGEGKEAGADEYNLGDPQGNQDDQEPSPFSRPRKVKKAKVGMAGKLGKVGMAGKVGNLGKIGKKGKKGKKKSMGVGRTASVERSAASALTAPDAGTFKQSNDELKPYPTE